MVLGRKGANHESPNPLGVRGRNSPVFPAMRRQCRHKQRFMPVRLCGQLASERRLVFGRIENGCPSFFGRCLVWEEQR